MAKCLNCGETFNASTVRGDYDDLVGDGEYNDDLCAGCAIPEWESNVNIGRAIMMMNGEEAYDAGHVEKWL
jgi:hypothetical protein